MNNPPLLKEKDIYIYKMNNPPLLKEKDIYMKMEYSSKTVNELRNIARDRGMVGYRKLRKAVLIDAISRHEPAIVDEATKDVVDDVKVSVASVPAIETRVLVPKPSGLWSAIGSLYNKTKSVINTLVSCRLKAVFYTVRTGSRPRFQIKTLFISDNPPLDLRSSSRPKSIYWGRLPGR